jgi:hypothetical protein
LSEQEKDSDSPLAEAAQRSIGVVKGDENKGLIELLENESKATMRTREPVRERTRMNASFFV